MEKAASAVNRLQSRITAALKSPAQSDPVYQAAQRVFHKEDDLVLTREHEEKQDIRRAAFIRQLHGCPPRKPKETSLCDAFNWEWIVRCAKRYKSNIVILSRDTDWGVQLGKECYANDHLSHEFSERVSRKRQLILCNRPSAALKYFKIDSSEKEIYDENALIQEQSRAMPLDDTATHSLNFDAIRALLDQTSGFSLFEKSIDTSELKSNRAARKTKRGSCPRTWCMRGPRHPVLSFEM